MRGGSYEGFYVTASQSPPLLLRDFVGLCVIDSVCLCVCASVTRGVSAWLCVGLDLCVGMVYKCVIW